MDSACDRRLSEILFSGSSYNMSCFCSLDATQSYGSLWRFLFITK